MLFCIERSFQAFQPCCRAHGEGMSTSQTYCPGLYSLLSSVSGLHSKPQLWHNKLLESMRQHTFP